MIKEKKTLLDSLSGFLRKVFYKEEDEKIKELLLTCLLRRLNEESPTRLTFREDVYITKQFSDTICIRMKDEEYPLLKTYLSFNVDSLLDSNTNQVVLSITLDDIKEQSDSFVVTVQSSWFDSSFTKLPVTAQILDHYRKCLNNVYKD